jgi:non-heme chloroperoxidase
MGFVTSGDGTEIYYQDYGTGRPVVLSHGWPLHSDSWEAQMLHLAGSGYRVVAHDRRGHGRSARTWDGNDMDHYADDLAAVLEALDLRDVTLIGFSTGGGEVARYVGRHGTGRVVQLGLISAVPPLMAQGPTNPDGVPMAVFDELRAASVADRAQLYRDLADGPFFGNNRAGANVSQGMRDNFWLQSMQAGHKSAYDSIKAFSETDFRDDLAAFDVPTLVLHGEDDQIVPIDVGGRASAAVLKDAEFIMYEAAPHGLTDTHKQRLNDDLLRFLRA